MSLQSNSHNYIEEKYNNIFKKGNSLPFVDKIDEILKIQEISEMDIRINENIINIMCIFQTFYKNILDKKKITKEEIDTFIHSLKFVDTLNLFMSINSINTLTSQMRKIEDIAKQSYDLEYRDIILKQIKYTEMTVITFKKNFFKSKYFIDGKVLSKELEYNLDQVYKNGKFDQKLFKQIQNLFYVVQSKIDEIKRGELKQKLNDMKTLSIQFKRQRYGSYSSQSNYYYEYNNDYTDHKNYSNTNAGLYDYNDNFYDSKQYYDKNVNSEYNGSGYMGYQDNNRYFYGRYPYRGQNSNGGYIRKFTEEKEKEKEKEVDMTIQTQKEDNKPKDDDIEVIQFVMQNNSNKTYHGSNSDYYKQRNGSSNNQTNSQVNTNIINSNQHIGNNNNNNNSNSNSNNAVVNNQNVANGHANSNSNATQTQNKQYTNGFKKKIMTKKNQKQRGMTLIEVPFPIEVTKENNETSKKNEAKDFIDESPSSQIDTHIKSPKVEDAKPQQENKIDLNDTEIITKVVNSRDNKQQHGKYYYNNSGYKNNTYGKNSYYNNYSSGYYYRGNEGSYYNNTNSNVSEINGVYYSKRNNHQQNKKYYNGGNQKIKRDFVEIEDLNIHRFSSMNDIYPQNDHSKKVLVEIIEDMPSKEKIEIEEKTDEFIPHATPIEEKVNEVFIEGTEKEMEKEKENDFNELEALNTEKDELKENPQISYEESSSIINYPDINENDFHQSFINSPLQKPIDPDSNLNLSDHNQDAYIKEFEEDEEAESSSDSVPNDQIEEEFNKFVSETCPNNQDDNYYIDESDLKKNNKIVFEDENTLEEKIKSAQEILNYAQSEEINLNTIADLFQENQERKESSHLNEEEMEDNDSPKEENIIHNEQQQHKGNFYFDSVKIIEPKIFLNIKSKLNEDYSHIQDNNNKIPLSNFLNIQNAFPNGNTQMFNRDLLSMIQKNQRHYSNVKTPMQSIFTNNYNNFLYNVRDSNIHREYIALKSQELENSNLIWNNITNFENKILIPLYQRITHNSNKKRNIYSITFIRYKKLIQRVLSKEKILKKVKPYGSYINNFLIDSGDIDICIVPKCNILEFSSSLEKIKDEIITRCYGEHKLSHHTNRYLLLKIQDNQTNFIIDITVHTMLPLLNTNLIRLYSLYDQRFHIIGLYVKHWAKLNKIHGAADNYLSSYALLLMLIHFLQKIPEPRVLPNLQKIEPNKTTEYEYLYNGEICKTNIYYEEDLYKIKAYMNKVNKGKENKETAANLLLKFFEYYSYYFDSEQIISINKDLNELVKKKDDGIAFSIEDPFDIQLNPGKSMMVNSVQYNKFITAMKREINFILNGEYVKRLDKIIEKLISNGNIQGC